MGTEKNNSLHASIDITPSSPRTRSAPKPDVLKDARRIRDILALHAQERRATILDAVAAELADFDAENG